MASGGCHGSVYGMFHTAATRYIHAYDCHAAHSILAQNFSQLFRIIHTVEFWTAYERYPATHKATMKPGIGIGRAICRHKEVSILKIRRIDRSKLYLYRPKTKLASFIAGGCGSRKCTSGLLQMRFDGLFIVGNGFAKIEGNGSGRTGGKAITETITIVVTHKMRLTVLHDYGPLVTGRGTEAAAGTGFFIDMNNSSKHVLSLMRYAADSLFPETQEGTE